MKQHLQTAYLGPTPLIETKDSDTDSRQAELVCLSAPKSTASESYRGIRTNILFASAGEAPQVILVSSPGPREGKTLTTANLAVTMAQAGSRVLTIDCDLRRPKIHKMFGFPKDRGLTNLLVGNATLEEAIIHSEVPNLDILPSGPLPPNPSEMLGSKRMGDLLKALRKRYDRILIDSPPVTAVTDAVILGKSVDGVVMVIRAAQTVREVAKNSIHQLHAVGANILGVVLNAVDIGKDKYYYYYYYQYYHYYYGDDGEKKKRPHRKKRRKKSKSAYYGREGRDEDQTT